MTKDIKPTNPDEQTKANAAEQHAGERKAERKAMGIRHP